MRDEVERGLVGEGLQMRLEKVWLQRREERGCTERKEGGLVVDKKRREEDEEERGEREREEGLTCGHIRLSTVPSTATRSIRLRNDRTNWQGPVATISMVSSTEK